MGREGKGRGMGEEGREGEGGKGGEYRHFFLYTLSTGSTWVCVRKYKYTGTDTVLCMSY